MATEVLADDRALRQARRRRALAAMEAHGIDAVLLGREANARYVSGARRLWTAGSRPFGPGCVVVRDRGAVHLVSTWDEGVPEDIPHEHLFGITWNPGNLLAWLKGIDGLAEARRIGTDSLTPRFAQLLAKVFPGAELVDAEPALEEARRIKTPEEIAAIRGAVSVAEAALDAAVAELRPGVSERHLAAVFMEAMARHGVTTPATQHVARISPTPPPADGATPPARPGDVVVFDAGVVAGGYTGELTRTWPAEPTSVDDATKALYQQADDLWNQLLEACRPAAPCRELLAVYESGGHALPDAPIAAGLGLGFDRPVVAATLRRTAEHEVLEPDMALALTARVTGEHGRVVVRKDAVLVTAEGPTVLSLSPHFSV
jgi:Xaa-Pro dipeptidase